MSTDERKTVAAANPPQPQISDGPWWIQYDGETVGVLYSFLANTQIEYWFLVDDVSTTPAGPNAGQTYRKWTNDLFPEGGSGTLTLVWIASDGTMGGNTKWDYGTSAVPKPPPRPTSGTVRYKRFKYTRTVPPVDVTV